MNHVNGDPIPCPGCGYAVCSCPDDGWELSERGLEYESYRHEGGALVWSQGRNTWYWGYEPDAALACSYEDAKPTKAEAMAAALELYARTS
jgi:hypothetical protein